ncbi:MAG TPA: hypothetical protein VIP77_08000 [Jiangellaceae bacterium]
MTEKVYWFQLRPVLTKGAEAMDQILGTGKVKAEWPRSWPRFTTQRRSEAKRFTPL